MDNSCLTSERNFIMDLKLKKAKDATAAALKHEASVLDELQIDKVKEVNDLIIEYHIRKSLLSKKAQKMLATRKAKAKTAGKTQKKKARKKSGKKRVAVPKQATANTAA